jgi:hypothetical protein
MSMKSLTATVFGAALIASAMGALAQDTNPGDDEKSKTCCMSACGRHASGRMRCSLTGKTVETCCCIEKEGKLHCTLAGKDVETCCCTPEEEGDTTHESDHDHEHTEETQQ